MAQTTVHHRHHRTYGNSDAANFPSASDSSASTTTTTTTTETRSMEHDYTVAEGYPPNALPGQCFARVLIPAKVEHYTEQALDMVAQRRTIVIPATYGTETKQVLVKEASTEFVVIPATYKTVTETITVKPATSRLVITPAEYETVTEQVMVRDSYTTWKVGRGLPGSTGETRMSDTGEILCLVRVPAEYATVTKQVLKTAEHREVEQIPAETQTITRQVVDVPAHVEKREIPAEYSTVTLTRIVTPESTREETIPATYKTVEKTRVVSASHLEWYQILCEVNTTSDMIGRVQSALQTRGFYSGPINGLLDDATGVAIVNFQKANNLASGQLTLETVNALGVSR
jgi:hypothetical protein